jgi:hypothetical protein
MPKKSLFMKKNEALSPILENYDFTSSPRCMYIVQLHRGGGHEREISNAGR